MTFLGEASGGTELHASVPRWERFLRELDELLGSETGGAAPALLVASPDQIEDVAIEFGSPAAEQLMTAIHHRIEATTGDVDLFRRVNEHCFALVCRGGERAAALHAIRLQETMREPIHLGEERLTVGLSVGIAARTGASSENLLRCARAAMRAARTAGGARHALHSPEQGMQTARRLAFDEDMRRALAHGEFVLHYQPLVSLRDGRVQGLEALIRWNHPRHGMLPPGHFLPAAEASGLIGEIGAWAMREACRRSATWQDDPALADAYVSVNVSGRQLAADGFEEDVRAVLAQTGARPDRLMLELTESVLMQNASAPACVVQSLRDLGVRVALDDFGTGYSSLAYLRSFPISVLKVDRSFVRDLLGCETTGHIVSALVQLADALELTLVAEGVETEAQAARLAELGCDTGQGYLFSRPVAAESAERLLRDGLPADTRATLEQALREPRPTAHGSEGPSLTLSDACRVLGVSPNTLRRWADQGTIACDKTRGGHRRFPESAVRELSRARARPPVLRTVTAPREPIPAAVALLDGAGDAVAETAVRSIYVEAAPGWLLSEQASTLIRDWWRSLCATCRSGNTALAELATDRLIRAAYLNGTTFLERDLLVERFFELVLRELAAQGAPPEQRRQFRRLSSALRQRALRACDV